MKDEQLDQAFASSSFSILLESVPPKVRDEYFKGVDDMLYLTASYLNYYCHNIANDNVGSKIAEDAILALTNILDGKTEEQILETSQVIRGQKQLCQKLCEALERDEERFLNRLRKSDAEKDAVKFAFILSLLPEEMQLNILSKLDREDVEKLLNHSKSKILFEGVVESLFAKDSFKEKIAFAVLKALFKGKEQEKQQEEGIIFAQEKDIMHMLDQLSCFELNVAMSCKPFFLLSLAKNYETLPKMVQSFVKDNVLPRLIESPFMQLYALQIAVKHNLLDEFKPLLSDQVIVDSQKSQSSQIAKKIIEEYLPKILNSSQDFKEIESKAEKKVSKEAFDNEINKLRRIVVEELTEVVKTTIKEQPVTKEAQSQKTLKEMKLSDTKHSGTKAAPVSQKKEVEPRDSKGVGK